jgi:ferredoxin
MSDQIKVEVDHEMCYGAQNCKLAAPGAFTYDDEGKAVPADMSLVTLEQLRTAESGCPAEAITVSTTVA